MQISTKNVHNLHYCRKCQKGAGTKMHKCLVGISNSNYDKFLDIKSRALESRIR